MLLKIYGKTSAPRMKKATFGASDVRSFAKICASVTQASRETSRPREKSGGDAALP
jgi:hypothetical protein